MDSTIFRASLAAGELDAAKAWLDKVKGDRGAYPQYDDRALDHRERELFQAAYKAQNWKLAKEVVEGSIFPQSKLGRMGRLSQLAGKPYSQI